MGDAAVTRREVHRHAPEGEARALDEIAVEEPLEIRVDGEPLVLTMRTPGEDRFLAVGLLFAEGVIRSVDDVGTVAHCGRPGEEGFGNVIDVAAGPGVALDASRLEGTRRGTLTTASCGVCGRRSIDDLLARIGPMERACAPPGGVHAATVLPAAGAPIAHEEEGGRHNAVDKAVGKLLYDGRLDEAVILAVSGRVSFEIVQKAAAARIPIVVAVSAPTSLAVDLATRAGITLCAFVRAGRMNVYTGEARLG